MVFFHERGLKAGSILVIVLYHSQTLCSSRQIICLFQFFLVMHLPFSVGFSLPAFHAACYNRDFVYVLKRLV